MKTSSLLLMPILSLWLISASVVGVARDQTHTPAKGSAERKTIVDVLREDYRKQTGDQVTFLVNYMKVHNGWAWVDVTPLGAKGKPVAEGGPSLLHYEKDKWLILDLSTIPEDPDNPMGAMDPDPKFIKEVQKKWPGVPADIFPKRKN